RHAPFSGSRAEPREHSTWMNLKLDRVTSILDVDAAKWNTLAGGNPFHRHEFLAALERSGAIGPDTAWQPCHLTADDDAGDLVGALPLYVKYDSRGEFVFDWSWADAWERAGGSYYPKLVSAVPFTPATGRRFLTRAGIASEVVAEPLIEAARALQREIGAS